MCEKRRLFIQLWLTVCLTPKDPHFTSNPTFLEFVNKNASKEQFETAIEKEMKTLGIDHASVSSILAHPVFVNAEPIQYK